MSAAVGVLAPMLALFAVIVASGPVFTRLERWIVTRAGGRPVRRTW